MCKIIEKTSDNTSCLIQLGLMPFQLVLWLVVNINNSNSFNARYSDMQYCLICESLGRVHQLNFIDGICYIPAPQHVIVSLIYVYFPSWQLSLIMLQSQQTPPKYKQHIINNINNINLITLYFSFSYLAVKCIIDVK